MQAKLIWGGRVISGLIALMLTMSAAMKLMGGADVMDGMAHLGIPESLRVPLGILELSCVAIYLVPTTAVTGAILLTGYVGGAIVTHLRVGEPVYMQIALGVLIWLGLYLRDARLKALVPWRTSGTVDSESPRSTSR